jgi:hypothetical protein
MLKPVLAVTSALALLALATAATGSAATAAPRGQTQSGRITGIAVDPSDPLAPRGPRFKAGPQTSAGGRPFNGFASRFSVGQRVRQW